MECRLLEVNIPLHNYMAGSLGIFSAVAPHLFITNLIKRYLFLAFDKLINFKNTSF